MTVTQECNFTEPELCSCGVLRTSRCRGSKKFVRRSLEVDVALLVPFSHAARWPAAALGQPRPTLRTRPDSLGVGVAMLLIVEEGPHVEALRYGHLLRPQPVSALWAGNIHRPSKLTFVRDLLHTSDQFWPLGLSRGLPHGLYAVRRWLSGAPLLLSLSPYGFSPQRGVPVSFEREHRSRGDGVTIHRSAWKGNISEVQALT
jgi:hypothetical protein